ncbi:MULTISPECIES: hypothetical protein [unclassified Nocardia]|uniref:hypothetical protein n=1 Tax=unclassified Nocardia TaxID=2637762 RepID=UPI001CE40FC3|nr:MULTISPECIES: hypothetical protein [unclassified Nocardia]
MSPNSANPQSVSITFTGSQAAENLRGLQGAIRRGIQLAVADFERSRRKHVVVQDLGRIYSGRLPVTPVLALGRSLPYWIKAGGYLQVETDNAVAAVTWGRFLFGERGFVVFAKPHEPGRFIVRALIAPLHKKDFGDPFPAVSHEPGHAGTATTTYGAIFVADSDAILVSTADDFRYYRDHFASGPTDLAEENIERLLTDPAAFGAPTEAEMGEILSAQTGEHATDLDIAHIVVALDRSVFATIPIDDRRRYLRALTKVAGKALSGVDSEQLAAALVELIASCASKVEMEALLAPLVAEGLLPKLFAEFDKPVLRLLHAVGSHLPRTPLEPRKLWDIVVYNLNHPLSGLNPAEAAGTAYDWARSTASSLGDLPLLPAELISSAPGLYRLFKTLSKALGVLPIPVPGVPPIVFPPDPAAQTEIRLLLSRTGESGQIAMLGLEYIEGLTGAAGALSSALMRRVMRVILLEILAAYLTGSPGARAAEIAKRVAAQVRLVEVLAGAAKLADVAEAGRLMWLLPESMAGEVARLAELMAAGSEKALIASAEADRVVTGLRIAEVIETKAGRATELAEDVAAGAKQVIEIVDRAPSWSGDAAHALLKGMAGEDVSALLRIAGRLTPAQLGELGPELLARMSGAKGALEFTIDAGPRAFVVTAREFGTSAARYERFLAKVVEAKKGLGPQEYYELVQRLSKGDLATFADAESLAGVTARANPAAPASESVIREVEQAISDQPTSGFGPGNEAATVRRLREEGQEAGNVNRLRSNFPLIDVAASGEIASVKAGSMPYYLSSMLDLIARGGVRNLKVEQSARAIATFRRELQQLGWWPRALRKNASVKSIAEYINGQTVLRIPSDHVLPFQEYLAAAARRNPARFGLNEGPDLEARIAELLGRVRPSAVTSQELFGANERVQEAARAVATLLDPADLVGPTEITGPTELVESAAGDLEQAAESLPKQIIPKEPKQ